MRFVYVIPVGGFLVALALIGGVQEINNYSPDPDDIYLYTSDGYKRKAEAYANQGDRQEALNTCAAMESEDYSEYQTDSCLLNVYKVFDETDNIIAIYEKQLAEERAAGDSGDLTEHVLNIYREERDNKK